MTAKTHALIVNGTVRELVATAADVTTLYHPSLHWVDVTGQAVEVGWTQTAEGFAAPTAAAPGTAPPTIAELQAQLAALGARLATLQAAETGEHKTPAPSR